MEPALIGLAGTIFGGVGLKIIEHFLGRSTKRQDLAAQLRAELRADVDRLRQELKAEATSADVWQEKYWALRSSTMIANHKADRLLEESDNPGLKDELQELKNPDK